MPLLLRLEFCPSEPDRGTTMRPAHVLFMIAVLGLAGCRGMGPRTIASDRIAYNDAIATSWKQQILLNIVRVRYGDMAEFIDVGAINNSYELSRTTQGNFGAGLLPHNFVDNNLAFGWTGSRSVSDRPSIEYKPQTGPEFTRNLINPIAPTLILSLIEGGTSADTVMDLAVESIHGIRNRQVGGGEVKAEHDDFTPLLTALRIAHAEGDISFRFQPGDDERKTSDAFLTFHDTDPKKGAVGVVRQKLEVQDPKVRELKVVFGTRPGGKGKDKKEKAKNKEKDKEKDKGELKKEEKAEIALQARTALRVVVAFEKDIEKEKEAEKKLEKEKDMPELALQTRSVLRVMRSLSEYVQVPVSHLTDGRAPILAGVGTDPRPHLTVYSSCKKPCDSFAAIHYHGHWFWIEHNDDRSKRTISYLRTFLALADTGERVPGPVRTIRVN